MEPVIKSVSELTREISVLFEEEFGMVTVQGEISNFKAHSSGHRYFTLKDDSAQISCTMWRSKLLSWTPTDGMKVVVKGYLSVYPQRGQYQIECESITTLGLGELFQAFEALKRKLSEKGYFEANRKRPIPDLPLKIGVSTSPTGAAVKDIFSTIKRRLPACGIYFRPTLVQGDGSAEDIVSAISELGKLSVDVIIIGRGGGSIEDLWSYNTEIVANAIFNSNIPVVSAVGHETDFTIADFVADVRAATPTAAAELVTPLTSDTLNDFVETSSSQIYKSLRARINSINDLIDNKIKSYSFRRFSDRIKTLGRYIDDMDSDSSKAIETRIALTKQKINSLEAHCNSLNPYSPLSKGFALLESEGMIISNSETLGNFMTVDIIRKTESVRVHVDQILKKKRMIN